MSEKNIFQRMSEATEKIERVAKNLKVGFGNSSYKAVSEADIINAVKPIEKECGIYSYPISRSITESAVMTSSKEYNGEKTEKQNLFLRIETTYRFVNADKPEEFVDVVSYGDGVDPQDKAPGKAMTYADKYALMKAYKIETGDDPDAEASGELKSYQKQNKSTEPSSKTGQYPPSKSAPAKSPTPPASPVEKPVEYICTNPECKKPITEQIYGGKRYNVEYIHTNMGGLCWDCYAESKRKEADSRGV